MWRDRAIAEYKQWPMTIFGTMTFRPEIHYLADARLTARLGAGGTDFFALTEAEKFGERSRELGSLVTNWLKVVRHGFPRTRLVKDRPQFRYLIVCEAHDGARTSDEMRGRPHFHCLIHVQANEGRLFKGSPLQAMLNGADGEWIRKSYQTRNGWKYGVYLIDQASVRTAWQHGLNKFQWCENEQTASYLTKYLSKTLDARVRASQGYGDVDRIHHKQHETDVERTTEKGSGGKEFDPSLD